MQFAHLRSLLTKAPLLFSAADKMRAMQHKTEHLNTKEACKVLLVTSKASRVPLSLQAKARMHSATNVTCETGKSRLVMFE
jgi:hypothetical protein